MKVGIMTFWWSDDNYGQLLQCYALQKYLQNIVKKFEIPLDFIDLMC